MGTDLNLNLGEVAAAPSALVAGANLYNSQLDMPNQERGLATASIDAVLATATSAVVGIANTGIAVANMFSNEPIKELSVQDTIGAMDEEAAGFYQEHQSSIDAAALVVGSVVPGLLGVKALRLAMAGGKAMNITRALNLHDGLIAARAELNAANITGKAVNGYLDAQFVGVVAKGFGTQTLDALAFETAATLTQFRAPAYSDATGMDLAKDVFWNSLTGGVVGGAFSGVKSAYQLKAAKSIWAKKNYETQAIHAAGEGQAPDVSIIRLLDQRIDTPADMTRSAAETHNLTVRHQSIQSSITEQLAKVTETKADSLAQAVASNLMKADTGSWYHSIAGLESIKTVGTHLESMAAVEAKIPGAIDKAVAKGTAQARGAVTKLENIKQQPVLVTNLKTGEAFTSVKDVAPHLGDMIKPGNKIEMVFGRAAITIDKQVSKIPLVRTYTPEADVHGLQATRLMLAEGELKPRLELNTHDYPEIEHHIQNWPKGADKHSMGEVIVGDKVYSSPSALRMDMQKWKLDDLNKSFGSKASETALNANYNGGQLGKDWDLAVPSTSMSDFVRNPLHAVMTYSQDARKLKSLDLPKAEAYIRAKEIEAQKLNEKTLEIIANKHGLSDLNKLGVSDGEVMDAAKRNQEIGTGGSGIFTGANADLGSVGSFMQNVGAWVNKAIGKMQDATGATLRPHLHQIQTNWETHGVQLIHLRNKLALSEANYATITPEVRAAAQSFGGDILKDLPENGLIRQDAAKWLLTAQEKGKLPAFDMVHADVKGDLHIKTSSFIQEFHEAQSAVNMSRRGSSSALDSVRGHLNSASIIDNAGFKPVYNVPVDTSRYGHFVLVSQKDGVGATSHKSIMTAKSEAALQAKILALESHPETAGKFNFTFKKQTADYFKAKGEYEYTRGMNENIVDSAIRRRGVLGDAPESVGVSQANVTEFLNDHISWNNRMDARLVRDMVETKYTRTFQHLTQMGEQHELATNSNFGGGKGWWYESTKNPYADVMKMALNVSNKDNYAPWVMANEFAERTASTAFGTISRLGRELFVAPFKDIDASVAKINAAINEQGIGTTISSSMLAMHKDLVAQRPVLYSAIQRMQALFSGLTLGLDPLNALNNAIGNVMLTGELSALMKGIKNVNPEVAGRLAEVKIPGLTDSMGAPTKLIGSSIARYWKGGDVWNHELQAWEHKTGQELVAQYRDHGIISDTLHQHRLLQEEFGSNLNPDRIGLNNLTDRFMENGRKLTGNNFAEEFSRFLAADTARQITDHAMKQKLVGSIGEAATYWATTANRAQGVIISAQRPVAFQGPIGASVGLFMSYQMNMIQQFARYAGTGQFGAAGVAMAAQTSLYGLQGLPAFNAINTHLIGNSGGNLNHKDMYSGIKKDFGNEAGDWMLYGIGSNALGIFHPDLKFNLYTRGDINPRQLTVLPTSLSETPIYKATVGTVTNFMDMVQNMAGGAGVRASLLHALEHNGLNRPLSGLASVLAGKETSRDGKLLSAIDNNFMAIGVKLAGGKELDSAQANDALYRFAAYKAHDAADKKEIAQELRISTLGDGATNEQLANFQQRYARAGGKIDGFNAWAVNQYKFATVPQANLFATQNNSQMSHNMQAIMGYKPLRALTELEE